MNRTRINRMLGVLLFPYLDVGLQKEDWFRKRYESYRAYMGIRGNNSADLGRKQKSDEEFKKATNRLIEYLELKSGAGTESYDDLLMLCELYYPLAEVEKREGQVKDGVLRCYLNNLWRIAASLLTYRDGIIAIRLWNTDEQDIFNFPDVFDKVQIWNMLCCYMVPDILIAAFAVQCNFSKKILYEQKPYISLADKLLVKILQKGMAENHLHFKAGFDYEAIWLNYMNLEKLSRNYSFEKEKRENIWAASVFRILAARFFRDTERAAETGVIAWAAERESAEAEMILQGLLSGEMHGSIPENAEKCEWLKSIIESHEKESETDYLLATIYRDCADLKTSSEFILLYDCFTYLREGREDECFARIFLQYIRIKNELFQNIHQWKLLPGLRHFQRYFDAAKQAEVVIAGEDGLALDVFRAQAKQTYLKKLEIRIAPDIVMDRVAGVDKYGTKGYIREKLCRQLYEIFFLYRRYLLESVMGVVETNKQIDLEEREERNGNFSFKRVLEKVSEKSFEVEKCTAPTLGILYHLLKMEKLEYISGYSCARAIDREGGLHLGHRLFIREIMAEITEVIEELRGEIPYINEYIVGLDAASDENAMEPWMFAPAYNRMRRKEKTKPVMQISTEGIQQYSTIQNMGFTYHVGEDFRHIASGLRHVDEVIENFHYKAGDRLGHAIVLGININKWVEEHEMAVLPLGEHLDNLLWIWGKSVYDGKDLSVQFERLEKEILECAGEIYGNNNGEITVMMLYEAYKKKFMKDHRNIIDKLNEEMAGEYGEKRREGKRPRGYCKYMDYECGACHGSCQLWNDERLLYTNYCPVFEENRNKVITCSISENDVRVYTELQEDLLRKVEKKGIYVETNPTSNVTIGYIEDLREHPVFRMNSMMAEGHHVMVTVNSDDPAVFNTNVENELSYIYHAMGRDGYPKEDILNWIDKIRQNGVDASFVQRVKDVRTLLQEAGSILDELKKYR